MGGLFRKTFCLAISALVYAAQPDPGSLQALLDSDNYIAYQKAMQQVDATQLTNPQRSYFLGMFAYHLGKLNDAVPYLTTAVNTYKRDDLTSVQVEGALETLAQIHFRLGHYGASASVYDNIDKIFGPRVGDADKLIREKRHLSALLKTVAAETIDIPGDFTLQGSGIGYPAAAPGGEPVIARLDTGAEISIISASTAQAWNATLLEGTATLHGYGGGGFHARPAVIPVLMFGKATLHNIAAYVVADEDLDSQQVKLKTKALLGYPVIAALGRLTFRKDGSLTISATSPARDLRMASALWYGNHSLVIELATQVLESEGKIAGGTADRLFMLDTGSASTWLTDHYLAEHTNVFHGPPPDKALLAGIDGVHEIAAYVADPVPLFAGSTMLVLRGQHILATPEGGEAEHFFGLIGQDVLGTLNSYTVDLRNMTFTASAK